MKQRKILVIGLACVLGLGIVIGTAFFLGALDREEPLSTEYTELQREESIVYQGKEYVYNKQLNNYLFIGVDTQEAVTQYETSGKAGQADAIYIISYNRVEQTAKGIAIPRDTMTQIQVFSPAGEDLGFVENHINLQYAFGDGENKSCELMQTAVENLLLGVPIDGYCSLNIAGIPFLAEVGGGVKVTVPDTSLEKVNPIFKKGETVILDKETAEVFVRYRDINERQSANVRMQRQKVFMKAFMEQAKTLWNQDEDFLDNMNASLEPYMVTDIGSDEILNLLEADFGKGEVFVDLPGTKVSKEEFDEYHVDGDEIFEFVLKMFYKEVKED